MKELALAIPGGQITPPTSIPQGGLGFLKTLLNNAITIFLMVGLMLVVIYLVWGGVQWVSSGGDKAKLSAARSKITWALIGFILLLLSFFILNALGTLFNVPLLNFKP